MEQLIIAPTRHTPKIAFRPLESEFSIEGNSMPENATAFYTPILEWVNAFVAETGSHNTIHELNIQLHYFNSASMRYLTDILDTFTTIYKANPAFKVLWFYEEGDELLKDAGTELSELINLPFEVVEIT